jgi:hypothetical protein
MQDIGAAAPLYDLCKRLAIKDVYKLPIHMIPWQMPYPIGVEWPVIQYGDDIAAHHLHHYQRTAGYILLEEGGKGHLFLEDGQQLPLNNVAEAASKYHMGPRPLFSRPCIAVRVGNESIGVLIEKCFAEEDDEEDGKKGGLAGGKKEADIDEESALAHALHRLCIINKPGVEGGITYVCYNPLTQKRERASQDWVERSVLAIGTNVLIKAWCSDFKPFLMHIPKRRSGRRTQAAVKEDGVHVCAVLCPPRSSSSYMQKVWVSVEVRHQNGSLRNLAHADMISLAVSPDHLLLNNDGTAPKGKRAKVVVVADETTGKGRLSGADKVVVGGAEGESGIIIAENNKKAAVVVVVDYINADKYAAE